MTIAVTLWQLQTIDQELDDKTHRLDQVDGALANDPAMATAQNALSIEQKKVGDLRAALNDRELEAKGLDAKIKELSQRLYSGNVSNPKELDGLSKDVEMHKRQRNKLDDKLLELMEQVDQAQNRVNAQAASLEQIKSKRSIELEKLNHERETLNARLNALKRERDHTRNSLSGDAPRIYDQLRRTKGGRAVVQLRRDSCGACGVTVPTGLVNRVRTGDEIVYCTSCGRILAA